MNNEQHALENKPCEHKRIRRMDWPDNGSVEVCTDCLLTRHHWEQGETEWQNHGYKTVADWYREAEELERSMGSYYQPPSQSPEDNIPDFIWLSESFGVCTGTRANSVCYKRYREPGQELAEAGKMIEKAIACIWKVCAGGRSSMIADAEVKELESFLSKNQQVK